MNRPSVILPPVTLFDGLMAEKPAPPQKPEFKRFIVTLRFQFPAWDEKEGIQFQQTARTKAEAIKYARREADNAGHLCGGKGRVTFKAVEAE